MFSKVFHGALILLVSAGVFACRGADESSDTKFAVFSAKTLQYSLLAPMSSTGKLNVCIGMTGFSDDVYDKEVARTMDAMVAAVKSWTDPLVGMPEWKPASVTVNLVSQKKGAYVSQGDTCMVINAFAAIPKDANCDVAPCKCSFAHLMGRVIYVSVDYYSAEKFIPRLPYVVRHELGHLLGLADTYGGPDGGLRPGQPVSTMGKHNEPLESDDIVGIKTAWQMISQGPSRGKSSVTPSCPSGYKTEIRKADDVDADGLACVPN